MKNNEPIKQTQLFGLKKFFNELILLDQKKNLPNKILLSGQKGIGKSTMAYHLINYILSKDEDYSYDLNNLKINPENRSFKTLINKSNPNFTLIDISLDKKFIEINQIREMIINLNKSSFNDKPRFVLIDNIEYLNLNSVNALLKILEEPSKNIFFILINNNKKILSTLSSRCINFKIFLTSKENMIVANELLNNQLYNYINEDIINHYSTPGCIYNLILFAKENNYDLLNMSLDDLLKVIIKNKHYKKNVMIKNLFFDLIEFYFRTINVSLSQKIFDRYNYFLQRISETRRFNLDEDTLFIEIEKEISNG
tara:strand:+ start:124 stop:1056 length:933 start_codon:yes stop_codon:yes gene_type:complete